MKWGDERPEYAISEAIARLEREGIPAAKYRLPSERKGFVWECTFRRVQSGERRVAAAAYYEKSERADRIVLTESDEDRDE